MLEEWDVLLEQLDANAFSALLFTTAANRYLWSWMLARAEG